jgi:alkanesulfonate monooxygenase SsuD/methylene tetrahydromethanopterin reductase-like flavin-dependent oxidoreductase (luciferase family)
MKTKLFVSLLLLTAAVAPRALAAADGDDRNLHPERGQLFVTPLDDPAVKEVLPNPAAVPSDPRQVLQDYDSLMIALTQKFSATLATIAEAVKRGEVSSEQAREMSADSMELLWSKPERAAVESRLRAAIVGSDATVQAGLEKLVRDTRADEVIVVTDTYEHSDRMDSYERVSRIAAEIKLVPNVERRLK